MMNNGTVQGYLAINEMQLRANSIIQHFSAERERDWGRFASMTYGGARDIYGVAGYPTVLTIQDYLGRYGRQDIATRIVNAAPDDTWRKPPRVLDGPDKEKAKANTKFAKAWAKLVTSLDGDLMNIDGDDRTLWYYLHHADCQSGIGHFGLMVLGFANGQITEPLVQGQGGNLLYINVLNESQCTLSENDLEKNPQSPRFGRPAVYNIDFGDGQGTRRVHYSRVIHIAEGGMVWGVPRMKNVYNRLIDVEKLLAGSGEAGWRSVSRRVIFSTKDGFKLGETTATKEQVDELLHGNRFAMEVEGMEVNVVSGDIVDPSGPIENQVDFIAGGTGIPQRKLLGSEHGELASSQDDENWNDLIATRRTMHAEPVILRPLIRRLIYAGALPSPSSGSIYVDWPSLYELDDQEQSQVALNYAQVAQAMAQPGIERGVKPHEFMRTYVRGLPAEAIPTEEEIAALDEEKRINLQRQQLALQADRQSLDSQNKPDAIAQRLRAGTQGAAQ